MLQYLQILVICASWFTIKAGPICYDCTAYDHPQKCAHVVKCGSNQVCYVESNITTTGTLTYNSGCIDNRNCDAVLHPYLSSDLIVGKREGPVCKLCCQDDYCNIELCDLHKEEQTGPRCLSCDGVDLHDPKDCTSITQCGREEMCYAKKVGLSYQLGCVAKNDCRQPSSQTSIDRNTRIANTGGCHQCCAGSYCNAHLCGNLTLDQDKVFEMNGTIYSTSSQSCEDTSYETCQIFLQIQNDPCSNPNVQKVCPRSCKLCVDTSCTNNATFDCEEGDRLFHICRDYENARKYCRKFCRYCSEVIGAWTAWSTWSQCSKTCESGTRQRRRSCTFRPPYKYGKACLGNNTEEQLCNDQQCPINGGWTLWETWSSFTFDSVFPCGNQVSKRRRYCSSPSPLYGGSNCTGNAIESRTNSVPCRNILRLNGGDSHSGRLEIKLKNFWGTVCDDFFTTVAAQSVCYTLGLPYVSASFNTSVRAGSGSIWLDDVRCPNRTIFPIGCNTKPPGYNDCVHDEDIGVTCR